MQSDRAKVLHCVDEHSMLWHVLTQAHEAEVDFIVVVVGHQAADVMSEARRWAEQHGRSVQFAQQREQLGTGHAVQQAHRLVELCDAERVLVLSGDVPLLRAATLRRLLQAYDGAGERAQCSMLTFRASDPHGMGRIVRSEPNGGAVERIVEQKDCANEAERAICEVNAGVYVFRWSSLRQALPQLQNDNAQNEYYLTDVVRMLTTLDVQGSAETQSGAVIAVALDESEQDEALGVNTRSQLDHARHILQSRR